MNKEIVICFLFFKRNMLYDVSLEIYWETIKTDMFMCFL